MTVKAESPETTTLLRLRIAAEADPGVLTRVLGHFQNLNVLPHRVVAEFATNGVLHVQLDTSGISERRMSLIAAKMAECVSVVNAYWHWL
jgi:hypothetical protein